MKNRSISIRPARPADLAAIYALGRQMHRETAFARIPWNGPKATRTIENWIRNPDIFLVVAEAAVGAGDEIVGAVAGRIQGWYFGHGTMATDMGLFVRPDARRSRTAFLLVEAFEEYARGNGCLECMLSTSSGYETERVGRFFERRGYTHRGTSYVKRIGAEPEIGS